MINKQLEYMPEAGDTLEQYLAKAKKYNFRCVFVNTEEYDFAKEYLKDTDVLLVGDIDFPEGVLTLSDKMAQIKKFADKGFKEIDYVINQKNIENKNFKAIHEEMQTVRDFCAKRGMAEKPIVEMCKLDNDEAAKREICKITNEVRPTFLKTSTGRSFGGAKISDVKLMKEELDDGILIKAAGGIHHYKEARAFLDAGADVLGSSSAVKIIEEEKN